MLFESTRYNPLDLFLQNRNSSTRFGCWSSWWSETVNRIQNEKDIIGTWKDANAEEVFTFQENGELAVSKDMPDSGLSCGNASYGFSYSDIICVTQGDSSVEFEIEVDHDELTIFFMGQEYLELEK